MKVVDTSIAIDCKITIELTLDEAKALSWPAVYGASSVRDATMALSREYTAKHATTQYSVMKDIHAAASRAQKTVDKVKTNEDEES